MRLFLFSIVLMFGLAFKAVAAAVSPDTPTFFILTVNEIVATMTEHRTLLYLTKLYQLLNQLPAAASRQFSEQLETPQKFVNFIASQLEWNKFRENVFEKCARQAAAKSVEKTCNNIEISFEQLLTALGSKELTAALLDDFYKELHSLPSSVVEELPDDTVSRQQFAKLVSLEDRWAKFQEDIFNTCQWKTPSSVRSVCKQLAAGVLNWAQAGASHR
jgi:hypothetical protein